MRVHVDHQLCQSMGLCTGISPETFAFDDDDNLVLLNDDPPEEFRAEIQDAVFNCPTGALSISD